MLLCVVKGLFWVLYSIPLCEYTTVCLFTLDFGIFVLFSLLGHLYISFSYYAYLYSLEEKFCMLRYLHHCVNLVSVCVLSCSFQFSHSVKSDSLWPLGLQHTRCPCPSQTPVVHSNSCPLSRWCLPTISSSVIPFFSCLQSFPESQSFPVSQSFASGGQSMGVSASASVLPMNIQDLSPWGWTDWISLQSKGLSRVFSNTTVQKHQFFGAQLCL